MFLLGRHDRERPAGGSGSADKLLHLFGPHEQRVLGQRRLPEAVLRSLRREVHREKHFITLAGDGCGRERVDAG